MVHAVIERFQELEEAFAGIAGRGGRLQARFCAAAALDCDLATDTLIRRTEGMARPRWAPPSSPDPSHRLRSVGSAWRGRS